MFIVYEVESGWSEEEWRVSSFLECMQLISELSRTWRGEGGNFYFREED
jgi:hypothetical protein